MTLRERLEALIEEYDRVPRLVATGTVARMLREWLDAEYAEHKSHSDVAEPFSFVERQQAEQRAAHNGDSDAPPTTCHWCNSGNKCPGPGCHMMTKQPAPNRDSDVLRAGTAYIDPVKLGEALGNASERHAD